MAFHDFRLKTCFTNFAFALVYDWLCAHVASIADVREVINLRTLRFRLRDWVPAPVSDHSSSRRRPHLLPNWSEVRVLKASIQANVRQFRRLCDTHHARSDHH